MLNWGLQHQLQSWILMKKRHSWSWVSVTFSVQLYLIHNYLLQFSVQKEHIQCPLIFFLSMLFFFFLLYAILLSLGSSEYSLDKYHLLGWIVLKSSVNSTVCLSIYPSKFYFQIISCLATDWSLWTNGCLYLLRRHEIHVCPFLKPIMCY